MKQARVYSEPHFRTPDWRAPLDLRERLAHIPSTATVRGLFFNDLFAQFPKAKVHAKRPRYLSFNSYPFSEWCQVLTESALSCFPGCTPREGVRRIGRRALPALAESHAGRVLFAMAGHDPLSMMRVSSKAFALAQSVGSCWVSSVEPGVAVLQIREAWDYPDAYYVGVYEGVFEVLKLQGDIEVCVHSMTDVDLRLRWKV